MKTKRLVKAFYILVIVLLALLIYNGFSIYSYASYRQLKQADAIIVLGAGTDGEEPSPVFRERINHGIWLYQNQYGKKIIFTGGKTEGNKYADSIVAQKYAENNSVPSKDILVETRSRITEENLFYAKLIAKKKGLKSFIIVSDPLHMKRAMLMAKDYHLSAFSSPTPSTRYKSWRSKLPFLLREIFFYSEYVICRPFNKRRISWNY